jgi:capsid protein
MPETYARATLIPQAKGYSEAGASTTKRALKGFDAVSGSPNEDINYNNFASLQQLALVSWLLSGDVFALIKRRKATPLNPYTLRLHIIEADRISTPLSGTSAMIMPIITDGVNLENNNRIYDGVEVGADGDIRGYWIRNTYPGQIVAPLTNWARVEAQGAKTGLPNILHIMSSERPEQYRGVPFLAPVIEVLLQIRRFTESELVAAVVQSFFTA